MLAYVSDVKSMGIVKVSKRLSYMHLFCVIIHTKEIK